jgi:hypothetical protein
MARFGESFLQQLGRPGWTQGMFGLGQAIGGAQGQIRDQRKQQAFNQLMKQGQAAMASGNATQLAQVGQQLAAAGYQKEAQQFATASREAKLKQDRIAAASGLLGTDPAQAQKSAEAFVGMGDIDTAMKAMDRASELQNRQVRNRYATTLASRARAVGINLTPNDVLGSEDIGQIAKDVRAAELKKIERTAPKAYRMVRLQEAGFDRNNLPFSAAEINAMPREEFDSFINSQKADLKFFEDREGNIITARVNQSSGLIENPNYGQVPMRGANVRWMKPESMGLLPRDPVTTSKVFNMNNEVNEQLLQVGLSSYEELTDAAKMGNQAISSGTYALQLVEPMYAGMAAGAKLGLDRIGKLLADATGVEYDATAIASTEEFVINRLQEMANFIQKLGSGTGLSDNDAKIAMQAVAGDKSLDKTTLMNIISQYIQSGQFAVKQFDEATSILSKEGDLSRQDLIKLNSLRMQVFQPKTTQQRVNDYLGRTQ